MEQKKSRGAKAAKASKAPRNIRAKPGDSVSNNLMHVSPMTENQSHAFSVWRDFDHLVMSGSAGTGKTFLALYFALKEVCEGNASKIIIIRSAVSTRDVGFLPGTEQEKNQVYEIPYIDTVSQLLHRGDAYEILKKKEIIKFATTSFLRGTTFDNAIIILDECQNMNADEINTVMTRVGNNSRVIVCGDFYQDDLKNGRNKVDKSGFTFTMRVIDRMNTVARVEFNHNDVVRSGFVKDWIISYETELKEVERIENAYKRNN